MLWIKKKIRRIRYRWERLIFLKRHREYARYLVPPPKQFEWFLAYIMRGFK